MESGFGHHENVQLMAGLGTRRKSDDVVKFHNINEVGYDGNRIGILLTLQK
jgi:hypothetical protein